MESGRHRRRVLVTGGTGFIGRAVVSQLVARGDEVAVLTRRDNETSVSVASRITADLRDQETVSQIVLAFQPDLCYHLAWYTEPTDYLRDMRENFAALTFSLGLLADLIQVGCRHFTGVGSCAEYTLSDAPLSESAATRPATVYGAAKLGFSTVALQSGEQANMSVTWARPFYVYGPGEDPRRAVPRLIRSCLAGTPLRVTEGAQVRDYLHVRDVASALVALSDAQYHGVANVCSGRGVHVDDLADEIARVAGSERAPQRVHRSDVPSVVGSPGVLSMLDWEPEYDLSSGLSDAIRWWAEHAS